MKTCDWERANLLQIMHSMVATRPFNKKWLMRFKSIDPGCYHVILEILDTSMKYKKVGQLVATWSYKDHKIILSSTDPIGKRYLKENGKFVMTNTRFHNQKY